MRQEANNIFRDGLNMDLHPMTVPKSVLTDNLNGTFITYNGNELLLQNDLGNIINERGLFSINGDPGNGYEGRKVIGLKECDGILYIVSIKFEADDLDSDYRFLNDTEIGTYPSPTSWDNSNEQALVNEYKKLHIVKNGANTEDFSGIKLNMDINHPIEINIQRSYDGSVNLILIDDKNPIRCINSGFAVLPNGNCKIIERNGENDTNRYKKSNIDYETRLIKNSSEIVNIDLVNVQSGGQLMGGNYTFYIKFGDADYNQTDIVAESGIVSIFKGNDGVPTTISGTLMNERTDKLIQLKVTKLDRSFSKIYVYYTREYSDLNGVLMTEAKMLVDPFDITIGENQIIQITGFEQTDSISIEDLNIYYHTVDSAKTGVQLANRLFIGNINRAESNTLYEALKDFTYDNITINPYDGIRLDQVTLNFSKGQEYYSTQNIYNSVGYWPGEMYRFGIVYILNDGSTTPVFFPKNYDFRKTDPDKTIDTGQENANGIVIMPENAIYGTYNSSPVVKPIGLTFTISNANQIDSRVKGWFVVRQKRIPNKICQGLMIGVDRESKTPVVYKGNNEWISQSFLSFDRETAIAQDRLEHPTSLKYNNISFNFNSSETQASILSMQDWLERDHGVLNNVHDGIYEYYYELPYQTYYYQIKESPKILGDSSLNDCWLEQNEELFDITPTTDAAGNIIFKLADANNNSIIRYEGKIFKPDSNHYYTSNPFGTASPSQTPAARYEWPLHFIVQWTDQDSHSISWAQDLVNKYNQDESVSGIWVFDNDLGDFIAWVKSNDQNSYYTYNYDYYNITTTFIESSYQSYCYEQTKIGFDKKTLTESLSELSTEALLSLDPCVNKEIQSLFDTSEYYLSSEYNTYFRLIDSLNPLIFAYDQNEQILSSNKTNNKRKMVFVGPNTNYKSIQEFGFSTIAGNANEVSAFKKFTKGCWIWYEDGEDIYNNKITKKEFVYKNGAIEGNSPNEDGYNKGLYKYDTPGNINLLRGKFAPFIGINSKEELSNNLGAGKIYTILKEPFSSTESQLSNQILIRKQDNSEFYCISNRIALDKESVQPEDNQLLIYRGDCYTNTIAFRMIRNFSDPDVPTSDTILDEKGWRKYAIARGVNETDDDKRIRYDLVNRADVNTVDLGYWVVFKCLSSQNLGLRSIDEQHLDELALTGTSRSFFPLNGADTSTGNKLEESFLLNAGYSTTVGRKRYDKYNETPYTKSDFSTRVMFSNVDVTDYFSNGYRTFQGASYHDYETKYGEITKLLSWKNNLFCVFEHGLALLPVNEKALMQTTTDQTIHIYGHGVLSDNMTIISEDFGSKWPESVIRTPIGIYGMDHSAKKIWRFSDKGLETIADMKMQSFLNKNITIDGNDCKPNVFIKNIKTHYNARKGDVMFVLYNANPLTEYDSDHPELYDAFNICFNERQNIWVTRYNWYPSYSENIDIDFYSIDQEQTGLYKHSINATPCNWYSYEMPNGNNDPTVIDGQRKFEFEIAVNEPMGVQKILDDLQIIANNTQPEELEITILGDDYLFKRQTTVNERETPSPEYTINDPKTTSTLRDPVNPSTLHIKDIEIKSVDLTDTLQQRCIVKTQKLKDLYKYGRLRGNIQYKEGCWYTNIEPIVIYRDNDDSYHKSMKIRDKWAKIRIRYSGEKLAVISAIKTLFTISYA